MTMQDSIREIDQLKAELETLRAQSATEVDRRLQEREEEYRQRLLALDQAAAEDVDPQTLAKALGYGTAAFVQLMNKVDLRRVKEVVEQVQQKGYAIVPGVLDQPQVERVREGLASLFDGCRRMFGMSADPRGSRQTVHVQNVLAKTRAADEVATSPFLRAVIAGILGHDFILNAGAVAMAPDPGCSPQGLHRDDGFYALLPRPHMPLVVTVAFALDDFTEANGGTQLVPGSSSWAASRQSADAEVIRCEMPAGSMLLWDGAVLHGGGGNSTVGQTRRTLTLNYTRGWLRTQFNQYVSIPRDRILEMPAELQSDLGYHRSAGGLGGCDTQDPLKYLQRMHAEGGDGSQRHLGREAQVLG